MKIILSAYACEPGKGSEPAVGWNWALTLADRGHDVWVITRLNNRENIEAELPFVIGANNLRFVYFDYPDSLLKYKKKFSLTRSYYYFWQIAIYFLCKRIVKRENIDVIHHVTFAGITLPTFLCLLDRSVILGPVGGGEKMPWKLMGSLGVKEQFIEIARAVNNYLVRYNPLSNYVFWKVSRILVTSQDSKELIPKRFHFKTDVMLAIALPSNFLLKKQEVLYKRNSRVFSMIFAGRLLHWKGIQLILKVLEKFKVKGEVKLTIVGSGGAKEGLLAESKKLGVSHLINWVSKVEQSRLQEMYSQHDVFVYPSFHDSGGMAILEALSYGLPIVCLKTGGPGLIVDESCGFAVDLEGKGPVEIVEKLHSALNDLRIDPELRNKLSRGATERIKRFDWSHMYSSVYNDINGKFSGS